MKNIGLAWTALVLTFIFSMKAHASETPKSYDVCRVDQRNLNYICQHVRGKSVYTRARKYKTVQMWMAIPCGQLKKLLPEISCKKRLNEMRLGEPHVE